MPPPATGTQETPGIEPRQRFKGHTDRVRGVIHLPDGRRIITCSAGGSLRIWNLESGSLIGRWKDGNSPTYTIALSPDGKKVVSGGGDGALRLWDIETGKMLAKWTGHSEAVWSVCWSQDGQRVLSGSGDRTVRLWDVESGKTILGPMNPGHRSVYAVIYSPDESMVATGGYKNVISIWDAKTFKLITTLEVKGHTGNVWGLAWTWDGKTLISASESGFVLKWSATTWKQNAVFMEHGHPVEAIAISPNGRILATASWDRTARLWNLQDSQPIGPPLWHPDDVFCVSFSADGGLLATGCNDTLAYMWDVSTIVKEAGFGSLLLDSKDSATTGISVLDTNATRHLPKPLNTRLPQGFLHDRGDGIHSSSSPTGPSTYLSPFPPTHSRTLHDRFSTLFTPSRSPSRSAIHDATSRGTSPPSRPPHSTLFSRHRHSNGEQQTSEAEVPPARGRPRNIRVAAKSKERIPMTSNLMVISVAGPSRSPSSSGVTQPLGYDASSYQSSSQSHLAVDTAPVAAPASTTAVPLPSDSASDVMVIRHVGCWTRFWLILGCISAETNR